MKNFNNAVQSEYDYAYSTYSPSNVANDGILSELDVFNAHFALADFFDRYYRVTFLADRIKFVRRCTEDYLEILRFEEIKHYLDVLIAHLFKRLINKHQSC